MSREYGRFYVSLRAAAVSVTALLVLSFCAYVLHAKPRSISSYRSAISPVKTPISQADQPTTASATAPATLAAQPVGLFIGDGYAAGVGDDAKTGFACRAAEIVAWNCELDAQSGTGYVNDGGGDDSQNTPLLARLTADKARPTPDYIVVSAGANDWLASSPQFTDAATAYFTALSQDFPKAKVLILGPWHSTVGNQANERYILYVLATKYGFSFADPSVGEWYFPTDVTTSGYPNTAGHISIANHLAPLLQQLAAGKAPTN